jgi:hypothetical protein
MREMWSWGVGCRDICGGARCGESAVGSSGQNGKSCWKVGRKQENTEGSLSKMTSQGSSTARRASKARGRQAVVLARCRLSETAATLRPSRCGIGLCGQDGSGGRSPTRTRGLILESPRPMRTCRWSRVCGVLCGGLLICSSCQTTVIHTLRVAPTPLFYLAPCT